MSIGTIDTPAVLKILRSIWEDKPRLASRLRNKIECVIGYATSHGYRAGDNPARWSKHLENLLPHVDAVTDKKHHAALPFNGAPAFMARLALEPGHAAKALTLAILTATRSGEARGAEWAEIDFDAKLWKIPASRMKAGKEHTVPLSLQVMTLLRAQRKAVDGAMCFPGRQPARPVIDGALIDVIRRLKYNDLTVHRFRSTFRDWCGETTDYPREDAEMALAHAAGDSVEQAYRRGTAIEKRRGMMEAWANFVSPRRRPEFDIPEPIPTRPVFKIPA